MKFSLNDNAMAWNCFSRNGSGQLMQIKETMHRFAYGDILQTYTLPFANEKMPIYWSFLYDNGSRYYPNYGI